MAAWCLLLVVIISCWRCIVKTAWEREEEEFILVAEVARAWLPRLSSSRTWPTMLRGCRKRVKGV